MHVPEIWNTLPVRTNPHDHGEVLHAKNFKINEIQEQLWLEKRAVIHFVV